MQEEPRVVNTVWKALELLHSAEFRAEWRDYWLRMAGYGLALGAGIGEYLIHR